MTILPTKDLSEVLLPAYSPCRNFGHCKEAQWDPEGGHVPRGYLGATGTPEDVEVVMVFSEPGHPHGSETYTEGSTPTALMHSSLNYVYNCFAKGTDRFHVNVRWFISQLYPEMAFDEQLKHVWLTEGRLCSIDNEIGHTKDRTCAQHYLVQQISALPNATVVAFGGKAKHYLKGLGINFIGAYALAPPGANHKPARPSWDSAIAAIEEKRK